MRLLDLTLPTPAQNLALDEALLEQAEQRGDAYQVLRLWEPLRPMVVLGRSSRPEAEVHLEVCRDLGIPVLRRPSGGTAIVTGPGCLMYALVLYRNAHPALRMVEQAHRFVLDRLANAFRPLVSSVCRRGISDLAMGETKFSGNSLRCKRQYLLYHGTILYDFPLELIDRCLAVPERQPEYRRGRPHLSFLGNLPLSAGEIRSILISAWSANEPYPDWPQGLTAQLAREKYTRPEWNASHFTEAMRPDLAEP